MGLIDVLCRSRFTIVIASVALTSCGQTPREASRPTAPAPRVGPTEKSGQLAELEKPPTRLLSIDWSTIAIKSEAEALALWQRIALTGEDWEQKLDEIPSEGTTSSELALALLRGGNFKCTAQRAACNRAPLEVPDPPSDATFNDPCLRRLVAMWAVNQLEETDLPRARDAMRAIAAIPPPESQLIEVVLKSLPENFHDLRLELLATAFAAGQRDVVNGQLSTLDEPHLIQAIEKHHIDGALQLISAEGHRATFLGAIKDERMHPIARADAMIELVALEPKLAKDVHNALVTAARAKDCSVAAHAARVLVQRGERKFGPTRPRAKKAEPMMRALCVLASYEQLQRADEPSYLLHFIPQRGLEVVNVTWDEYSDPPQTKTSTLVGRSEVVLPELEDLVRAMKQCTGTSCKSDDREFKFTFKPGGGGELMLQRLEVIERPPCKS